ELDFRFHVPAVNPASYRLLGLSGDLTNGRSNMMSIDYRERQSGDFVTATEGTPSWMISALGGGHPWGAQTSNGLGGTKDRHSDPILATTLPDGLHVIVRDGDGTWGDLA